MCEYVCISWLYHHVGEGVRVCIRACVSASIFLCACVSLFLRVPAAGSGKMRGFGSKWRCNGSRGKVKEWN